MPRQRVYKLDQPTAEQHVRNLGIGGMLDSIENTKVQVAEKAADRIIKWHEARTKNTRPIDGFGRAGRVGLRLPKGLTSKTGRILGRSFDDLADMFDSLFGGGSSVLRSRDSDGAVQSGEPLRTADFSRFTSGRYETPSSEPEKTDDQERNLGRDR